MKQLVRTAFSLAVGFALVACSETQTAPRYGRDVKASEASADRVALRTGFGFNAIVSGFPKGIVQITGGGSYDPTTATNVIPTETTVHAGGGFSCLDGVEQLPLKGCLTGQGVRWDTAQLLESTGLKCTGKDTEQGRTAVTDAHTVVLKADFYRAGDANEESFNAKMVVADHDLTDQLDGIQNVWIQGVGCATATVSFSQPGQPFTL